MNHRRHGLTGLDPRRLRLGLALFFLALALPSAALVWQAFGRLEWEGFHQQQVLAEEFARRVDDHLAGLVEEESARGFADYGFLVVEGDPRAAYLQRSPLSVFPPRPDIPGLLGYFQVDAQGEFSSPLLPRGTLDPTAYGLTAAEVAERSAAEGRLEQILSTNRLVDRRRGEAPPAPPGLGAAKRAPYGLDDLDVAGRDSSAGTGPGPTGTSDRQDAAMALDLAPRAASESPPPQVQAPVQAQIAFDRLNQAPAGKDRADLDRLKLAKQGATVAEKAQANLGAAEQRQVSAEVKADRATAAPAPVQAPAFAETPTQTSRGQRIPRREVGVLAETEADAPPPSPAAPARPTLAAAPPSPTPQRTPEASSDSIQILPGSPERKPKGGAVAPPTEQVPKAEGHTRPEPQRPPIHTFESEIDPFEVSRLAGGQLVLYRKVWRDGQRYTQGALIDPAPFAQGLVGAPFGAAALSRTSALAVTYRGQTLALFPGQGRTGHVSGRDYASSSQALRGTPLYQARLSDPFSDLGLAFAVTRLPLGPGAEVIAWVAAILALVLTIGVWSLYRLGVRQIALGRQQQDFISAVSHELKTPLTSIRMYSEMLGAGWVSEDKRPGYYRFIQDESERLSRLIANVLQLARMTRNEQHLELRPVTCGELLDQARSKVATQVEGAGFSLHLDCPPDVGATLVQADPDAFAQILINLVDNALKFAAKAEVKVVEFGCQARRGGAVEFRVRDYGPGVPRDQLKKVFRLFYRADGALTRETLGTGIGLALVQGLVRGMGGSVDLVNRDPGVEVRLTLKITGALPARHSG
jgi:signal transduction histidine kinase